jgi:hypothetical protein
MEFFEKINEEYQGKFLDEVSHERFLQSIMEYIKLMLY